MGATVDRSFVLVGVGGLGAPLALALAAAGVRRLVLVDPDVVEPSNLQRQILYRMVDVGRPKVEAARDALLRKGVAARRLEAVRARFDETTARALLHDADVVCDGSDSLATKFFVNDVCIAAARPFVIGGVLRHAGQVFPVRARGAGASADPCYRCLFEAAPDGDVATCADAGVLGPTCGVVAALQARAALALATGRDPHGVLGRVWLVERDDVRSISFRRRRGCAACDPPVLEEVIP